MANENRVTQVAVEVLYSPAAAANMRVTQVAVEALHTSPVAAPGDSVVLIIGS